MSNPSAQLIAEAYARAPKTGPLQRTAYQALSRYVWYRYQEALDRGYAIVTDYTGAAPDLALVQDQRLLPVYNLKHAHPEFRDRTNFQFRAVHDLFGHLDIGADNPRVAPFGYDGEVIAARNQAADITRYYRDIYRGRSVNGRDAQCALAIVAAWGEIVGQAAYYETRGVFPEQKAVLLTDVFNLE